MSSAITRGCCWALSVAIVACGGEGGLASGLQGGSGATAGGAASGGATPAGGAYGGSSSEAGVAGLGGGGLATAGASNGGAGGASGGNGGTTTGGEVSSGGSADPSSLGPPGSPVALHGQLKAMGNQVVDVKGEPTQLKGMSLYWSDVDEGARYFDKQTIKWLASDWKVAVIRATIAVREQAGDYLSAPDAQLKLFDNVVQGALEAGIYVIADWHDHHANKHVEQAKDFFGKVADKYGSKPNLLFEIWNEPRGASATEPAADWNGDIQPYAQTISSTLRGKGAHGLMIVGTPNWDQQPDQVLKKPVQDENVAYTLHFYAGAPSHSFDGPIGTQAKAAVDGGLPLFVTEYGTTSFDNTGYSESGTLKWLSYLDEKKISYCNWSITAVAEGSAAIHPSASPMGNWGDGDLTQSGKFVRGIIRGQ